MGVPPSSILQGFSQQNVRLSTSFNRQTYEEIGDVTSKVFHGFSFLKHQIWPAGELSRSPGDFAIKLWGIIKHGCWAGCWGNPSEKPREKKSYVDSSWTQASHDLAMEYEVFTIKLGIGWMIWMKNQSSISYISLGPWCFDHGKLGEWDQFSVSPSTLFENNNFELSLHRFLEILSAATLQWLNLSMEN